jgi:hypothetical protein
MYVANCALNLGIGPVIAGDVIDAAGANFGPWVSLGKITQLSDRAIGNIVRAAMPAAGELADDELIEGSDLHPALIAWEDGDVPLGELVCDAFERSGLSPIAWNSLPGATRETLIWAEFQLSGGPTPALEAADSIAGPAPDEAPEGPHFTFDPAVHRLKYRGKVGGYWIVDNVEGALDHDANLLTVDKETYGRLKIAAKAGKIAYVSVAEPVEGNSGGVAHTEHDAAQAASTGGEGAHA